MILEYKVVFHPAAVKELSRFERITALDIKKAIEKIRKNPYAGIPLKGPWKGYLKFRVKSYRIIYQIRRDCLEIFILRIRDRKEAYRAFV
ncbi:MAG: type II toxin-antitoxin system RelE/ParE family toxin [Candidatus Wallbacteria bacterium]|nr:type II toxin-antitoxin system RelE/ParE family toxin [Candidatus Wallbacteria bacterium]